MSIAPDDSAGTDRSEPTAGAVDGVNGVEYAEIHRPADSTDSGIGSDSANTSKNAPKEHLNEKGKEMKREPRIHSDSAPPLADAATTRDSVVKVSDLVLCLSFYCRSKA
ncbi:unnamed protein product [Gongylonema pulchrum]|uniref:Uncharacterized protein n=1 Tax=Gongylonema pulchrum TaxID=637853 RepID=A0A183DQI6_9BILA|nr:unnamed protein product [Gongylonema pulchrum]